MINLLIFNYLTNSFKELEFSDRKEYLMTLDRLSNHILKFSLIKNNIAFIEII